MNSVALIVIIFRLKRITKVLYILALKNVKVTTKGKKRSENSRQFNQQVMSVPIIHRRNLQIFQAIPA